MKKRWLMTAGICLSAILFFLNTSSLQAEEFKDRPLTAVKENGEIVEVEEENGTVPEDMIATQALGESGYVVNFNTKGNAVTEYTEVGTSSAGYTNGQYGADAAYIKTAGGKVYFILAGVKGMVDQSQVQVLSMSQVNSVSYYQVSGGRLYHYISTNLNKSGYSSCLDNGPAPSYLTEGRKYYSYDGHYFYPEGSWHVMQSDYQNNRISNSVNASNPFYNYYQYLPLRSRSSYSGQTLSSLINNRIGSGTSKMRDLGDALVTAQNTSGTNALLVTGIAINESGWGKSWIALNKNNLFGWNAVDSAPGTSADTFQSPQHCVSEYANYGLSRGYLYPKDWRYYGGFLGNKASGMNVKYASDPYWGEKAANYAWLLDRDGGSADQYKYTIGIKGKTETTGQHYTINVRAGNNTSSSILYETGKAREYAVILLDGSATNSFYKIQSDGVVNAGRTAVIKTTGNYNFDTMYAYISSSYISVVSQGTYGGLYFDVPIGSWYYEDVKYVTEHDIMTGYGNGYFGPNNMILRAEFAEILYRLSGNRGGSYNGNFVDVASNDWYAEAVGWGYANGIITGYGESGYFLPNAPITREELVTMLFRYAKKCGKDNGARRDLNTYPDPYSVTEYAKESMSWAVANGIIQGKNGCLDGSGLSNRAECATMITRYMKKFA